MSSAFTLILLLFLLLLHLISFSVVKSGEWVSGLLYLAEYKEILLQYISLRMYFGPVFVTFTEGGVVLLTAETT